MTQRENISNGKLFTDMCEGLEEERLQGKELMTDFNLSRPSEVGKRQELMKKMFGAIGENCWVEPPIYFAYGSHVFIGDYFYANFNLTMVDDYEIRFGNYVVIGPNVTIAVTGHPIDPQARNTGAMYAFPVTIGNNVWIGASVTICPGVTIGCNCVIGAGSVVIRDIPDNSVAVGNPCRVLRQVNAHDKEFYFKNKRFSDCEEWKK